MARAFSVYDREGTGDVSTLDVSGVKGRHREGIALPLRVEPYAFSCTWDFCRLFVSRGDQGSCGSGSVGAS